MSYRLTTLRDEYWAGRPRGVLVCRTCADEDHPQLMLGKVRIQDPEGLKDPRPNFGEGRGVFGFNPILGMESRLTLGSIYVRI